MKKITLTRKIAINPVGNINEFYSWLRNEIYVQRKAKQATYNYMLEKEVVVDRMKSLDEVYQSQLEGYSVDIENLYDEIKTDITDKKKEALSKKVNKKIADRNKLMSTRSKESYKTFTEAAGYSEQTEVSKIVKEFSDFDGVLLSDKILYKEHLNTGIKNALADFKNDYVELKQLKRAPRVYRDTGILDIRAGASRELSASNFKKENNKYLTNITSKFTVQFNLGSKPSLAGQATQTLNGIMDGSLKLCDSKIQMKNNKIFLLLVVQQEVTQPILDKEKIMGIDLGMDIPAYVAMEFKPEWGRAFGNKKELLSFKTRIKKLKDLEKQRGIYARGGHGRKRKMKNNQLEALRSRESNFSKTYNHTLSKQIVDYALKFKIGTIRMEKLDGKSFKNQKMLGDWTYYMLQQMIQTKAEAKGITIEFVNPAYTSSVCSGCGTYRDGFKLGNRDGEDGRQFHCDNCGLKMNSDHNASVNISRGGITNEAIKAIQGAK